MRQTIAVDIDDTLTDSTELVRLIANERLGVNVSREAYQVEGEYWGYYDQVWEENGLTDRISFDEILQVLVSERRDAPFLPHATFSLSQLAKQYNVVLVTSREAVREEVTRQWFNEHLNAHVSDVYFTTLHRNAQRLTKGQICRELGACMLIDDNVEHCQSALAEGVDAILFGSYGWQYTVPNDMVRCRDWHEVLEMFDGK